MESEVDIFSALDRKGSGIAGWGGGFFGRITHGEVRRDQKGSLKHCYKLSQSLAFLEGWASHCSLVITRCVQQTLMSEDGASLPPPLSSCWLALPGCPCHFFFRFLLALVRQQTKQRYHPVDSFLFSPWNH